MKKVFQLLTVALAALAVMGCVKEKDTLQGVPTFTITATGEDVENPGEIQDPSKAGFTIDGTTLRLAWHDGDNIRVFNHANSAQNALYTIKAGFTDKTAQFEGPVVNGTTFDVVAPGTVASLNEAAAGVPNLVQNGNNNASHLTFNAKLENVAKADLGNIVFNSNWASDHGATLKKGAIVKFVLTIPAAVTNPAWVTLIQFGGNSAGTTGILENPVSVDLTGVTPSSNQITVYAQAGWDDIAFAARSYIKIGLMDASGDYYTLQHRLGNTAGALKAGKVNRIQTGTTSTGTSGVDKWIPQLFAGGTGTEGDPYLIASAKHLDNMHVDGVLKKEERVYFKLIKDIDMQTYLQSNTWLPLNSVTPYDYIIDFDGDGHTIDHFSCSFSPANTETDAVHLPDSKPSFFGLLYGTCKNVNFTNATINCNYGPAGILAGYVGYTGKKAVVQNVHVQGTVTRTRTYVNPNTGNVDSGTSGTGGLAGRVVFAYIDSSSADVVVTATKEAYVGGLFGIDFGDASRIRNCWTSGEVHGDQRAGGIAGGLMRPETQIINCYSTATVDILRCGGGIAGHCNLDNNTAGTPLTTSPENVIKGCIAWQTSFVTRTQDTPNGDFWSSGAVVAYTSVNNYLTDCRRHPNLSYSDYADVFTLYDQNNASPSSPLSVTNPNSTKYTHYYPYHGKAASSTRLSTVAQSLGWDSTVWDFSGDIPVLTGAVEAEPAGETPESGEPAVQALTYGSSLARSFPGVYSVRSAKSATQDGLTWSNYDISGDGAVKYFTASGQVSATWMKSGGSLQYQSLYVIDYDLANTDYEVKLVYCSPACVASQVHKAVGAIATINAGYELGSIALKANMGYTWEKADASKDNNVLNNIKAGSEVVTNYPTGAPKSYMPNNTIGDTGVVNWKNEGTFYCDGQQGVRIAFDGYGGGCTTNAGANTYDRTIKQERVWYRQGTDNEVAFVSSAPILDANYIRFGQTYKDRCSTMFPGDTGNSEHPSTHQTGLYPRTAVAIAYPEYDDKPHLLLIVVDGRYSNSSSYNGSGYSAYWLERHIANAFGPKYMLNLDGGGSSTMVVDGYGHSTTHVVNYPCDNRTESGHAHDHLGERARDSFICIIPKN
ncbi:MAG: phosphodiester glycosidase family protein [Bacteroidales bacterium]|nr:phosphodiester glycosidase family protein [Bacteroidales bacterium]